LLKCRHAEHDRVEAAMRELVDRLSATYRNEPELLGAFAAANTKWAEFRDAECKLRTYDSRGGTAFESYWLGCLTALDNERVAALRYMEEHP
jgi:uncharacterized protein YecT (DUF1311 family)